ncbi:DUF721 domain-containing protein [Actinomyces sp.]|uniref:DUF721 domain-containing protein n=1 Tax=Actinomyces sp. TaxID=29317 RepID=UPI0026DBD35F|nr:DciA family protein [Actinomyces sp.]MDO4900745.1 DciA family protein [Actinomyces sp.]
MTDDRADPGADDVEAADALAARALARERGRAWDTGQTRRALNRQAADADGVAAWDRRRGRGVLDADTDGVTSADMDRGPGLPPGRDRPGPTRFDPRTGKQDLRRYAERHGWASKLAIASVSVRWREIVGEQIAEHATIERFEPGRLTLRASSTAWAQQLRLLLPGIERQVEQALGEDGGAVEIRILGPAGPTWRHGRFGAARGGRGPRDTYG